MSRTRRRRTTEADQCRYNSQYCRHLALIWAAEHAATLLHDLDRLPTSGVLWRLPMWWSYGDAATQMSRPLRVDWKVGALVITDDAETCRRLPWRVTGWSTGLQGSTTTRTCRPRIASRVPGSITTSPAEQVATFADRPSLLAALAEIIDHGRSARYQLTQHAEALLADQIHRAHSSIRTEITASRNTDTGLLISREDLDIIANRLIYGRGDSLDRTINRAMRPRCFDRVDPAGYFAKSLARDAEDAIRVAIGDVRDHGRIVRRYAADHNLNDPDQIVAQLRTARPNDRIGIRSVRDSLAVTSRMPIPLDKLPGDTA